MTEVHPKGNKEVRLSHSCKLWLTVDQVSQQRVNGKIREYIFVVVVSVVHRNHGKRKSVNNIYINRLQSSQD
jgi:hypothetical protein